MKICTEYKDWIEEEVLDPIEKKKEGKKEECKKKKCKKICLCCNKWVCWIVTFFYWIIEWVVRIVGKWLIYVVCRIVSVFLTLLWTILVFLKWLVCNLPQLKSSKGTVDERTTSQKTSASLPLSQRPLRRLRVEVVIIDKDKDTKNPIDPAEIDDRIAKADRIFRESARIEVLRKGAIRRDRSASLYHLNVSSFAATVGEWLKGIYLLAGRDSARYITVYAVGSIGGAEGLHQPFYGSVFIKKDTPDTTLAHELGHALLSVDVMADSDIKGNLMYVPWDERERDAGWPSTVPTLTKRQWCSARKSRWLDWYWDCERC